MISLRADSDLSADTAIAGWRPLTVLILLLEAYRKTSNISRTLVVNKNIDHSDVVGASPVGAAPTTSSFLT